MLSSRVKTIRRIPRGATSNANSVLVVRCVTRSGGMRPSLAETSGPGEGSYASVRLGCLLSYAGQLPMLSLVEVRLPPLFVAVQVEWDTDPGIREVQWVRTYADTGPNEVQSITTFADDVDEVQRLVVSANETMEVQVRWRN